MWFEAHVVQDGIELARDAVAGRECRTDRERAKRARDLCIVDLLTKTGLRTSEAINTTMGSILYARFNPAQRAKNR
ncbi:hypothetical protein L810_0470 [Burkholderia sp. AU4i]|uniref:hypothetical protein n=1 Tax=Burkholderia sp. AU4i TaxID=1335308 RepID=UPI000398A38C|nr:hypothetical protein [Burkholderia sp. AU4i]ERJ36534.1 hypothetical protein L810_0470 [Burkholderia sp. AU4i]